MARLSFAFNHRHGATRGGRPLIPARPGPRAARKARGSKSLRHAPHGRAGDGADERDRRHRRASYHGGMSNADGGASAARPVSRGWTAAEIAAFFALLASYIWVWKEAFPGHRAVVLALYAGIGLETHLRRGESAREVGFRLDNLGAFLRLAIRWLALPVVLVAAAGLALGGWSFPRPALWPLGLAWSVAWGTAQQYGLACVFYRRLRDLLPAPRATVTAAGIFALLHLPNPFMVGLTLALGLVACALYERQPNVFGLGIVHATTSFLLANALPGWLTFDWMVGPQILERVRHLF